MLPEAILAKECVPPLKLIILEQYFRGIERELQSRIMLAVFFNQIESFVTMKVNQVTEGACGNVSDIVIRCRFFEQR